MNLIKDIKEVYDCLEDDLSKQVFEARLEYNFYGKFDKFMDFLSKPNLDFLKETDSNIDLSTFSPDETVIIYGAGRRGRLDSRRIRSREPYCKIIFCDSNYSSLNKSRDLDSKIISPSELISNYKHCKVIISIADFDSRLEVLTFLRKNGIKQILSGVLYDKPQYFEDFVTLGQYEVFVDAGVLDGGTSIEFAKQCKHRYKKIYLFEADMALKKDISKNSFLTEYRTAYERTVG